MRTLLNQQIHPLYLRHDKVGIVISTDSKCVLKQGEGIHIFWYQ